MARIWGLKEEQHGVTQGQLMSAGGVLKHVSQIVDASHSITLSPVMGIVGGSIPMRKVQFWKKIVGAKIRDGSIIPCWKEMRLLVHQEV